MVKAKKRVRALTPAHAGRPIPRACATTTAKRLPPPSRPASHPTVARLTTHRRTDSCIVDAGVTSRAVPGLIADVEHRGDEDGGLGVLRP